MAKSKSQKAVEKAPTASKVVVVSGSKFRLTKVTSGVQLFGTKTALATYLGVSKTQPGRWMAGKETPTSETAALVTDLDYVWDRIRTAMGEEAAEVWLRSANSFLGGSSPLDWLKRHGPAQVIAAFDAVEAGSYA